MARQRRAFKEQIARKLLMPNAQSVLDVSRETGIAQSTLYH